MIQDQKKIYLTIWLAVLGLLYAIAAWTNISIAYIDFGDGNYLYIASRIADGQMLYRDIMAPQPPMHVMIASFIIRVARMINSEPLTAITLIRAFSILIKIYTMVIIALISLRLFQSQLAAGAAALFFMVIPLGFWWNFCYESEPLMLVFLLTGFYTIIGWTKKGVIVGGVLHLLAVLTNMTAAPYICWIGLMLLIFDRRRMLQYSLPIAIGFSLVVGIFYALGADYLGSVFFNQVGTFPKKELYPPGLTHYVIMKIRTEGWDIIQNDFFYLLWGIVGLGLYTIFGHVKKWPFQKKEESDTIQPEEKWQRYFIATFIFWTYMSIGFVSKGATADYIFTIGEPLLCVMAGCIFAWVISINSNSKFAIYFVIILFLQIAFVPLYFGAVFKNLIYYAYAILFLYFIAHLFFLNGKAASGMMGVLLLATFWIQLNPIEYQGAKKIVRFAGLQAMPYYFLKYEANHELGGKRSAEIVQLIQKHSKPDDLIIAPPHFAFASNRNIFEEYSEHFIWIIKFLNEKIVDKKPGDGTEKVKKIRQALENQEIPVAVFNKQLKDQSHLGFWEIVERKYTVIAEYQAMNTKLWIVIPKNE